MQAYRKDRIDDIKYYTKYIDCDIGGAKNLSDRCQTLG